VRGLGAIFIATFLPAAAWAGNPWEELMGPEKAKMWSDPEGRFSIALPVNWNAYPRKGDSSFVDFVKRDADYGHEALVTVQLRNVPPEVKLSHLALRVTQEMRGASPNFQQLSSEKIEVAGVPAQRTHFTYQQAGNAQLTREVVQVVLLAGEQAWVITLHTAFGVRGLFQEDFDKMIDGFNPLGAGPAATPDGKRRRLRAGEMVNPEAIKY